MIRVDDINNQFNSTYNTNQFGFFRPVTDLMPAVHEVSLSIFHKLVGIAPRSQKVQDWLAPFLKTANVAVVTKPNGDKVAPYPKTYEFFASSRIIIAKDENNRACALEGCDMEVGDTCIPFDDIADDFKAVDVETEEQVVTLVPVNKWSAVTKHKTRGPSLKRPYVRQVEDGLLVLPKEIGVIVLDYYRKPVAPVFNYDAKQVGPDVYLEFKEQGSVHLEWSETLLPVFLYELGKRYGLTIQNQLIIQVRQLDKIFE